MKALVYIFASLVGTAVLGTTVLGTTVLGTNVPGTNALGALVHEIQTACGTQQTFVPIAIVGGGVAGYSAALFCVRAHIPAVVIAGPEPGGQLIRARYVENIPGFRGTGYDFIDQLTAQVTEQGVPTINDLVVSCVPEGQHYVLTLASGDQLNALAVIAATGATPKKLRIPGEDTYWARGVYTCAVCDGFTVVDKHAVIIGGGDVAMEHALHLSPRAKSVRILVRGTNMRAIASLQDKLHEYSNITVDYQTRACEIVGNTDGDRVTGLHIIHTDTRQEEIIPCDGIFLAIGSTPNTTWLPSQLELDASGHVINTQYRATTLPGLFSAGEISDRRYRRADSAMAQGSEAAFDAIEYIRQLGFTEQSETELRPVTHPALIIRVQ